MYTIVRVDVVRKGILLMNIDTLSVLTVSCFENRCLSTAGGGYSVAVQFVCYKLGVMLLISTPFDQQTKVVVRYPFN